MLEINDHNEKSCTGIEPALLSSAEKLNQNALTNRLRETSGKLYSGKYTGGRSNGVVTRQTIMNEL